jgi:hypothetical protein
MIVFDLVVSAIGIVGCGKKKIGSTPLVYFIIFLSAINVTLQRNKNSDFCIFVRLRD